MNPKIETLAQQHGLTTHAAPGQEHLEKFAEAIIAECIDLIETYRIPVGNSRSGEMAARWTYDSLAELRDEICERFDYRVSST